MTKSSRDVEIIVFIINASSLVDIYFLVIYELVANHFFSFSAAEI